MLPSGAMQLSAERRAELAETALQRSEAGRVRLRAALAEQRTEAEKSTLELSRQLLAAQKQLREAEGGVGESLSEAQMDTLRERIETILNAPQLKAAGKEIEAQAALLGSAHTFHVQQQRFHDRLQAELAALHRKDRAHVASEHASQAKLQELTEQLNAARRAGAAAVAPAGADAAAAVATAGGSGGASASLLSGATSLLGTVFGDQLSKAEQLPALQASFKSAMEEVGVGSEWRLWRALHARAKRGTPSPLSHPASLPALRAALTSDRRQPVAAR